MAPVKKIQYLSHHLANGIDPLAVLNCSGQPAGLVRPESILSVVHRATISGQGGKSSGTGSFVNRRGEDKP